MSLKLLSSADRAEKLAEQRLKGGARPASKGAGKWYVVKVDARRLEIADHLAALHFEVIQMFDGYLLIRSGDMNSDALTVEGTTGVASILSYAGIVNYYEVPDHIVDDLIGSMGAPPKPIPSRPAAEPPECPVDGHAQLEAHRALKRRRKNDRRARQRAYKATMAA
jgi:hypothetical protein